MNLAALPATLEVGRAHAFFLCIWYSPCPRGSAKFFAAFLLAAEGSRFQGFFLKEELASYVESIATGISAPPATNMKENLVASFRTSQLGHVPM